MRKLTRSEKIKITERAKTILIVLLACSCLASGYYVFDMYRDLDAVRSFWQSSDPVLTPDGQQTDQGSRNTLKEFLKLSEPELILINKSDARDEIPATDKAFAEVSEVINSVIKDAYSIPASEITMADIEEWKTAVGTDSLYVRYAGTRSTAFEGGFYKASQNALAAVVDVYEEVCLVADVKNGCVTAYIPDKDYKNIAKLKIKTNVAEKIDLLINSADINSKTFVYAFELNLDNRSEAEGTTGPMLVVPAAEKSVADIVVDVPRTYKTGLNFIKTTDFTMGLIDVFGYNQNTVRQYVNSDDVLIFVGETGTLSVYPEGYIEYRALGTSEGVTLDGQPGNGVYGATSSLISMIDRINTISGVLPELNDSTLKISDLSVVNGQPQTMRTEFDFYVDGCKVDFGVGPAITAIINNGVLTELKMQIKTVKKTETVVNLPTILDEIEKTITEKPDTKLVESAEAVYVFRQGGEKISAEWKIEKEN